MKSAQTFLDTPHGLTASEKAVSYLQKNYGSQDYQNLQIIRDNFYSLVEYPVAGQATFNLFGDSLSQTNDLRFTNLKTGGNIGQNHFLIKEIRTLYFLENMDFLITDSPNSNGDIGKLFADFAYGLFNAGVLTLTIGAKEFITIPRPFLYCPPADGRAIVNGKSSEVTLRNFDNYADLNRKQNDVFRVQPNILLEAQQNFSVEIAYPSGAVPVIATDIVNDTTNPLRIGVILEGEIIRPTS